MDQTNVDQLIQFALLAAGRSDDWAERELGPIHLIKYVYLADLAYAARHDGITFTRAPWQFFHFGPWAAEVSERIAPALNAIDATEKMISSRVSDDFARWVKVDDELFEELDRTLPPEVASAVKRHVKTFGRDTTELLHFVYATAPMVRAAPRTLLTFDGVASPTTAIAPVTAQMTAKQVKKHGERLAQARERIAASLAAKREALATMRVAPAPRYDGVFGEGVAWLDSLAGESPGISGDATFTEEVWTSPARGDRRD